MSEILTKLFEFLVTENIGFFKSRAASHDDGFYHIRFLFALNAVCSLSHLRRSTAIRRSTLD